LLLSGRRLRSKPRRHVLRRSEAVRRLNKIRTVL
jgi:hypothetical protein